MDPTGNEHSFRFTLFSEGFISLPPFAISKPVWSNYSRGVISSEQVDSADSFLNLVSIKVIGRWQLTD